MRIKQKHLIVTGITVALLGSALFLLPTFTHLHSQNRAGYPHSSTTSTQTTTPLPQPPSATELFALVNDERVKAGIPVLLEDPIADRAATDKCTDMVNQDYFAHVSPTGVRGLTLINAEGENTSTAGENLAFGFPTSQQVVNGWMNSPGHRANILNASFDRAGIAVCFAPHYQNRDNQYIEVQEFAHEL